MSDFDGKITASPSWADVPQLSVDALALGGADGAMNAQALAFAKRTSWLRSVGSGATFASLPRFQEKLRRARDDIKPTLKVMSLGSSVGVGATLPDPSTQAPGAIFTSALKAALDPAGIYSITHLNKCVNGSTASEGLAALNAAIAAGDTPDLVILAFGMNDGSVGQYNSGQTFPGFYAGMCAIILRAKAVGADVAIMTTPHASVVNYATDLYQMPPGVPQNYPVIVASPTPAQLIPPPSQSNITSDFSGFGTPITVGHRYLRVNQAMRGIGADFGCPIIDVERYAFEAMAKKVFELGSMALAENFYFNAGEFVHPNLAYHQASYHQAVGDFALALARRFQQPVHEARLNGRNGVNLPPYAVETAALDVYAPYAETSLKPLSVKAQIGAPNANGIGAQVEVMYIDPQNGDICTPAVRLGGKLGAKALTYKNYLEETGGIEVLARYNVSAGGTFAYVLPDDMAGEIRIRALNNGVALNQVYANEFSTHNGVLTLGTPRQIGAGTEFTVAISGLSLVLTAVFGGTSFYVKSDAW